MRTSRAADCRSAARRWDRSSQTNGFVGIEHERVEPFFLRVLSSLEHRACVRSKSRELGLEFGSRTDRIEFPAEVAQSVEQWSEESRRPRFAKSLGNSRLIPEFRPRTTWSKWSIVLRVRRAGRACLR